ncbi:hypothetical protein [Pseudoalteromonas umbrosa]|uniref:hypothetical protein n=1 Tax=Pseudoalteromonas umbrosa TaxID=3048489 RepID=UPI0024C43AC8|nr:hypothetical protein [Pseudoalteromonas sp. B95]MDK1290196.1 hypothetical protein [Pseudoalteromonas sp. B95]
MSVRDSIEHLQLRAFVNELDQKWSWWSSKKTQLVAPVIPDDRGLVYLHNQTENYVVAVTPMHHDLVYATEIASPKRVISGVLDGKEVVMVLTEQGHIEVLSPTLKHIQTVELSDPASDLVWAEDLLWVVGPNNHHIDIFYVQKGIDDKLVFAPYRFVDGVHDIRHVMWLAYSRSIVAVAQDKVYFISFDHFTVEEVPLPFAVDHTYAHNALVLFSSQNSGEVYCLDLANSALVDIYIVETNELNSDPKIVEKVGYYETWHGTFTINMVSISEPLGETTSTVIQSIEKNNAANNSEQPETVIMFEEKADYFKLQSTHDCVGGERYFSQPFNLNHDGDPLLVVSDGSVLHVEDEHGTTTATQAAWVTNENLRLERQYNTMDGLHFRSSLHVYEPVDEIVMYESLVGEMTGIDYQFDGQSNARLFLSNPTEAGGFWVGSFVSDIIKVEPTRVIQNVAPSVYSVIPTGTSVLTEFRLHYRDTQSNRSDFTPWHTEPPTMPEHGQILGYQVRCYMSTNDPAKTPEVPSFAVDQVRHERITSGFWDTYRVKQLRSSSARSNAVAALGDVHSTHGLYQNNAQSHDMRATHMAMDKPIDAPQQHFALGSTVSVRTMDANYNLMRQSAHFKLGNIAFEIQSSHTRNWTRSTFAFLDRQLSSGLHKNTNRGLHSAQGSLIDPIIKMAMHARNSAKTQQLGAEQMPSASGFETDTSFSRALPHAQMQSTIASRTYHNVMTYADVQYFLGLNAFASRLAKQTWQYEFISNTLHFGHEATYGASYPSRSAAAQNTTYTGDKRAVIATNELIQGARYTTPFQAFEGLHVAGVYSRRDVLGFDIQYYTPTRRRLVSGFDSVKAAIQQTSDFIGSTTATPAQSNRGETVLQYLQAQYKQTNRLALAQQYFSWRAKAPFAQSPDVYASHSVWAGKDDIDKWLGAPASSHRTLKSTRIGAAELRHLALQVGEALSPAPTASFSLASKESVKLLLTSRGAGLAEPNFAYPVSAYHFTPSLKQNFAKLGTLSLHQAKGLLTLFKMPSNKSHIADYISYLVTNQNTLKTLKHTIRYALDRIMMEAPLTFDFNLTGSTTGALADTILNSRGLSASSRVEPMAGINGPKTSAPAQPLDPAIVGNTSETSRINLLLQQGGSSPQAQQVPFYQVKGSNDFTDLFYEVLSSWSIESDVDKISFAKALLSADGADDMRFVMSRINNAASEVIKLVIENREIPAAQLVKFLTAAYLTSSLPDNVDLNMAPAQSYSTALEMLYKTLLRSSYADDMGFTSDQQGLLVSIVALRLFREAATAFQQSIFDITSSTTTIQASKVNYLMRSGAQWYAGDELTMSNKVYVSTLAKAQQLAYTNHTIKKFVSDIEISGVTSLIASRARVVPFALTRMSSDDSTVRLNKLASGHFQVSTLSFTLPKPRSSQIDVVPFALGETKTHSNSIALRINSGFSAPINILTWSVSPYMHSLISKVKFDVRAFMGSNKGAVTLTTRKDILGASANQAQTFTLTSSFSSLQNRAKLQIEQGPTRTFAQHMFALTGQFKSTLPKAIGMDVVAGRTDYEALIKLINTPAMITSKAKPIEMSKSLNSPLTDQLNMVIDAGLKRLFGEHFSAPETALHAEISQLKIGRQAATQLNSEALYYNANDWFGSKQSQMVDWAFSHLNAIPKSVFTRMDKNHATISELMNFKLDDVGLKLNDLIQLVSAKSLSTQGDDKPFTKANWSASTLQTRAGLARTGLSKQAIHFIMQDGMTRKSAAAISLSTQPAVKYWVDRIDMASYKANSRAQATAQTVKSTALQSQLTEQAIVYQTLRRTIENQVVTSIAMSPDTTVDGLAYTKIAGVQTHYLGQMHTSVAKQVQTKTKQINPIRMTGYATELSNRILHARDQYLLREIETRYHKQSTLNVAEQGVLFNFLAGHRITQRIDLHMARSQAVAQQLSAFMHRESPFSSALNNVAMLVANPHSIALKHIESVVIRWSNYLSDMTGANLTVNTMEAAVELIRVSTENLHKIDANARIFGSEFTLADVTMQIMQPLIKLHATLLVKEGHLNHPLLHVIGYKLLNGFKPRFQTTALQKALDMRLSLVSTKTAKASSERYKQAKVNMYTDALGRHMQMKKVNIHTHSQGLTLHTTYMAHLQPNALTLVRNDFHVEGSLQLINGRKAQLRNVTQMIPLTPWSHVDSMRLKSVAMKVVRRNVDLQHIQFEELTDFSHVLSPKADYWFPKFRHIFPHGLPNWLQDYGHLSLGLRNSAVNKHYQQDLSNDLNTFMIDQAKQQSSGAIKADQIDIRQLENNHTEVQITDRQWLKSQTVLPNVESGRYLQTHGLSAPVIRVLGDAWTKMLNQVNMVEAGEYRQSATPAALTISKQSDAWRNISTHALGIDASRYHQALPVAHTDVELVGENWVKMRQKVDLIHAGRYHQLHVPRTVSVHINADNWLTAGEHVDLLGHGHYYQLQDPSGPIMRLVKDDWVAEAPHSNLASGQYHTLRKPSAVSVHRVGDAWTKARDDVDFSSLVQHFLQLDEQTGFASGPAAQIKAHEHKVSSSTHYHQTASFSGFDVKMTGKSWIEVLKQVALAINTSHYLPISKATVPQVSKTAADWRQMTHTLESAFSYRHYHQLDDPSSAPVRILDNAWVQAVIKDTAISFRPYRQAILPVPPSLRVSTMAWAQFLHQVDIAAPHAHFAQQVTSDRLPVKVEADRWSVLYTSTLNNATQPNWAQSFASLSATAIDTLQMRLSAVAVHRRYDQAKALGTEVKVDDVITLYNIRAMDHVDRHFIRIKPELMQQTQDFHKLQSFEIFSHRLTFEQLQLLSTPLSDAAYIQLRESRYMTRKIDYRQTRLSSMSTSTDIKKHIVPNISPTKTRYSLALPLGVPAGHSAEKTYTPIRNITSTEFWLALRRDGRGYNLINRRPIGLKDIKPQSEVRVTDMKRINPQNVSSIGKKIEIVLRKTINKIADKLDFERLAAPSESQAYQQWMADLSEFALNRWDYQQQRVALSTKDHDEVIRIMRDSWFGNQWYAQKPQSMTEFYHTLRQALESDSDIFNSYKQTLHNDSALYNKLVQSNLVSPDVYNALLQAGLSTTQADMFFAQAKEVSKAHYMRLKQYQLGDNALYQTYPQGNVSQSAQFAAQVQTQLGDQEMFNKLVSEQDSAQRVDSMYEQYQQGLASLYKMLTAMGLSDVQIDNAYRQAAGGKDLGGIIHSKYASYQDMVNAVGQAYEQYLLSDPVANMHYKMMKPQDVTKYATIADAQLGAMDIIDRYKQTNLAHSDQLFIEYAVDMATVLDSIDYSLLKPLPFHDRVDVNLPIKFRSEDFRRYKAGIVQIDLMQWLRDLRTEYREELIAKIQSGEARGSYSPRAAMTEAIRNGVVEPILYRDPIDGSWLYRRYTLGDSEYNYIIWGNIS